ncbi:Hypothetical protein NGAL_HAMBI2605_54590 [Neorhizobium galegae bv. orientalis]|nr:Hypothetical protein NGAL_HAMBI2566_48220 [Neorhizobium galegae bv. orientalis]CDZ67180.1 Hypothetical protein NGAL_HAMBI2605_54590 [Neorhizobium galegae bv. orientalis]
MTSFYSERINEPLFASSPERRSGGMRAASQLILERTLQKDINPFGSLATLLVSSRKE